MKALALILVLASAQLASADELLCASKKDQKLYYSIGQVRLTAEINSPTLLSRLSMGITGSNHLGLNQEAEVNGTIGGDYVRFDIGSDAWCNYRLALPKGFMTKERTAAFLDANCEAGIKSSVRLNCAIQ